MFFAADDGSRRGHSRKLFKNGVDWILENLFLAIELLITGTVLQITVLVALRYITLNLTCVCTRTGNWTVL